jgi:hypothetical protein
LLVPPVTYARAVVTSWKKKSATSRNRVSAEISYRRAAAIA